MIGDLIQFYDQRKIRSVDSQDRGGQRPLFEGFDHRGDGQGRLRDRLVRTTRPWRVQQRAAGEFTSTTRATRSGRRVVEGCSRGRGRPVEYADRLGRRISSRTLKVIEALDRPLNRRAGRGPFARRQGSGTRLKTWSRFFSSGRRAGLRGGQDPGEPPGRADRVRARWGDDCPGESRS